MLNSLRAATSSAPEPRPARDPGRSTERDRPAIPLPEPPLNLTAAPGRQAAKAVSACQEDGNAVPGWSLHAENQCRVLGHRGTCLRLRPEDPHLFAIERLRCRRSPVGFGCPLLRLPKIGRLPILSSICAIGLFHLPGAWARRPAEKHGPLQKACALSRPLRSTRNGPIPPAHVSLLFGSVFGIVGLARRAKEAMGLAFRAVRIGRPDPRALHEANHRDSAQVPRNATFRTATVKRDMLRRREGFGLLRRCSSFAGLRHVKGLAGGRSDEFTAARRRRAEMGVFLQSVHPPSAGRWELPEPTNALRAVEARTVTSAPSRC